MDDNTERKEPIIMGCEMGTEIDYFAYWLEQDFPHVQAFEFPGLIWMLSESTPEERNRQYERRWRVLLPIKKPSTPQLRVLAGNRGGFPLFEIYACALAPGKVTVTWYLSFWGGLSEVENFRGLPHPLDTFAEWVSWRFETFGVQVTDKLPDPRAIGPEPYRPTVYAEKDIAATIVHYLCEKMGKTQEVASGLVGGVSPGTYRRYRKEDKLLSEAEYKRRTGQSIEDAAQDALRGACAKR